MKLNEKIAFIMLFTAAVGICTGAFFEVSMTGSGKEQLQTILAGQLASDSGGGNFWSCFFSSARITLPAIAAAFAAPYIYITIPVLPVWLFIKSMALGFSAAMTLEAAGLAGMSHIATRLMPPNMVLLPALAVLAAAAAQAGCTSLLGILYSGSTSARRKRKALHSDARPYFIIYFIGTTAAVISCLLEAFLLQLNF